jgi:beclin
MTVASLPPQSTHSRQSSDAEKIAQLPTSPTVKSAWQRFKLANSPKASSSTSDHGKQLQRNAPLPFESFVLLQGSVIQNIPPPTPSPRSKKMSSPKSRMASQPLASPQQSESDQPNPSPLSHHLRSTLRLFNLLSTRTDIDHPLCAECTQILLTHLQRQLDETKKERDGYIAFEKEVRKEKEREGKGAGKEETEKKIEKLKADERIAIEQMKEAERERMQLDEEMRALELEEKMLEEEEAEFVVLTPLHCLSHV